MDKVHNITQLPLVCVSMHILLPFFAAAKPPAENPFHVFSPNFKYSCSQLSGLLEVTRRRKNSTWNDVKQIYSARYAQSCSPDLFPSYGSLLFIALGIYGFISGRNTSAWICVISGIFIYLWPIWEFYSAGRNAFAELDGQSS